MSDDPRRTEAGRSRDRAARRDQALRRKRGVPVVLALVAVLVALAGGLTIGYVVRGEPPPASLQTVEREVPVVTVTVPADGAP